MDDIKSGIVMCVGSLDFVAHAGWWGDRKETSLAGDLEEGLRSRERGCLILLCRGWI
jgi:hypothetical protein